MVWAVAAGVLPPAVLLGASFAVAGTAGLVIAADVLAGVILLAALASAPTPAAPGRRGPGDVQGGAGRQRARRQARLADGIRSLLARLPRPGPGRWLAQDYAASSDYPAFRKIRSDLTWAGVSMRHYDHSVRPLLARLLAGALRERHRLDLARDAAAARELVGQDLWPLLDPSRPRSNDSRAPGVDLPTLSRIVDRLEGL